MIEDFSHRRLVTFAGLPAIDFSIEDRADLESAGLPEDVEDWAWRVGVDRELSTSFQAVLALFIEAVDTTRVRALIIGDCREDDEPDPSPGRSVAALIEAAPRFPALDALFLGDLTSDECEAAALAHAPVVARLVSLDLSLGAFTDEGAAALLAGQPLTHLAKLDLHHHYLSEEMMQRIRQALPGVAVNLDDARGSKALRYITVAE